MHHEAEIGTYKAYSHTSICIYRPLSICVVELVIEHYKANINIKSLNVAAKFIVVIKEVLFIY